MALESSGTILYTVKISYQSDHWFGNCKGETKTYHRHTHTHARTHAHRYRDIQQSSVSNFPSLHLRHNSFSNPFIVLPTSQLILQPFRCFTYVTVHSPTLLSLLLRHKLFTYVTWRAAHALGLSFAQFLNFPY